MEKRTGLIVEGNVDGERILKPAPKLGDSSIELPMGGAGSPWLEIHSIDDDTVSMHVHTMQYSSKFGSKRDIYYDELSKNEGGNKIEFKTNGNKMRVRRVTGYLPENSNS